MGVLPGIDAAHPVILITGANTGIGRITAIHLAKLGACMVLAGRDPQRTVPVVQEIQALTGRADAARFLSLDLADLHSVRQAAQAFEAWGLPLHALINNAGVAGAKGQTRQGFELAFGTNHLGHFHLTQLLLPLLLKTPQSRVVTVASRAHLAALNGITWESLEQVTRSRFGITEYAVSKLANILFASELARRHASQGLLSYSLHPGVIKTEVWRHAPWWAQPLFALRRMKTPLEGAQTTLHCVLHASPEQNGLYFSNCQPRTPGDHASNPLLARQLWERSVAWTKDF